MSKFISFVRLSGLIIALSLLSACSAVKLAYSQAPDLSYWWLDGYFDFNEQQTPKVRDELTRLFAWHRASELPKTADLLAQAGALMSGEISAQQACRIYAQGRNLVDNVASQALPALAELAPSMTSDQIAHLKRKHAKTNSEYKRDFIDGEAVIRDAKLLKQSVSRSESLYGRLDDPQLAAIKSAFNAFGLDAAYSLKQRQLRQQEFVEILTNLSATGAKATTVVSQQALRGYIQRAFESPDPAYKAYTERITAQACASFANIHASTTPAQRANAAKVLKGYEADLRILAAQK